MYSVQLFALMAWGVAAPPVLDRHGFELPSGAVSRLGSMVLRGGQGFDLTPDGKTIITAGNPSRVDGGEIQVWDIASRKLLRSFDHSWACSVIVTSDGKRAAVRSNRDASLWELQTGRKLWTFPPKRSQDLPYAMSVSPDGRLVALGGKHIWLLDADTGTLVRTITRREQSNNLAAVVFTPDGTRIVAQDSYEIRVWEVATGQLARTIDVRLNVRALAITPDGKELLAAVWDSKNRGVPVWDLATGKRVRTLAGHDNDMTAAVTVSPDGRWIATAGGPTQSYSSTSNVIFPTKSGVEVNGVLGCASARTLRGRHIPATSDGGCGCKTLPDTQTPASGLARGS